MILGHADRSGRFLVLNLYIIFAKFFQVSLIFKSILSFTIIILFVFIVLNLKTQWLWMVLVSRGFRKLILGLKSSLFAYQPLTASHRNNPLTLIQGVINIVLTVFWFILAEIFWTERLLARITTTTINNTFVFWYHWERISILRTTLVGLN